MLLSRGWRPHDKSKLVQTPWDNCIHRLINPLDISMLKEPHGDDFLDIDGWLREIGLSRHAETLRSNDVDFDVLRTLTETDLKELGLSLGDRKRLMQAIAARAATALTQLPSV